MLRGHIAPTEPVEHSCTCYIIQEHITHIHTKQPRTDARAHIYATVHAQHTKKKKKKKRPGTTHSFETVMRDAEERRKKKKKKKGKKRETHF